MSNEEHNAEGTIVEENVTAVVPAKNESTSVAINNDSLSPLVVAAMDKDFDPDRLERLLEIQDKYENMQAKKAYFKAVAGFKTEAPVLKKQTRVFYAGKDGKADTEYMHVGLGYALATISPVLSGHGLSLSFDTKQENALITVTAVLTHELGHSEKISLTAPVDNSAGKNGIQAIASTITYLKRHTAFALLGLEGTEDDDGRGYKSNVIYITAEQIDKIKNLIDKTGTDEAKFLEHMKVKELGQITDALYGAAMEALSLKALNPNTKTKAKRSTFITDEQITLIKVKLDAFGYSEDDLLKNFKIADLSKLKSAKLDEVLQFIEGS